ncbi:MAG: hypothetical protein Q8K61_10650 [Gallionella sp.]|nr:hypothetical protein [Gallionella sp.]
MKKTKIYREFADGKSGDVRSIKAEFRPFKYDHEMLEKSIAPASWNTDLFSGEFCFLCWRKTEKRAMKIEMAKVLKDGYMESQASGKYFGEVDSLKYDFNHIFNHVDDATFNASLPIINELVEAFDTAIKQPTEDNRFKFQCLLYKHAPNYVPQVILPGKMCLIDIMELKFRVLEHLFVLRWAEDKFIKLSAANRKPSAKFCSEHNQLNRPKTEHGKSRRLYQRDIKFKNEFHAKILEIMKREGLAKERNGWIETAPVSTYTVERIRKEAYDNLERRVNFTSNSELIIKMHSDGVRQSEIVTKLVERGLLHEKTAQQVVSNALSHANSTPELIIKMHSDGIRQCEIVKELVEHGLLNTETGRQVVSNTLRRYKTKQDTIIKAKQLKGAGMHEPEIATKLNISSHMLTRLLNAEC